MKRYCDLTKRERRLFDLLETVYFGFNAGRKSFVTVLGVLINKHKLK